MISILRSRPVVSHLLLLTMCPTAVDVTQGPPVSGLIAQRTAEHAPLPTSPLYMEPSVKTTVLRLYIRMTVNLATKLFHLHGVTEHTGLLLLIQLEDQAHFTECKKQHATVPLHIVVFWI